MPTTTSTPKKRVISRPIQFELGVKKKGSGGNNLGPKPPTERYDGENSKKLIVSYLDGSTEVYCPAKVLGQKAQNQNKIAKELIIEFSLKELNLKNILCYEKQDIQKD